MTNLAKNYIIQKNGVTYLINMSDIDNIKSIEVESGASVDIVDIGLVSDTYIAKVALLDIDSVDFNADNVISVKDYKRARIARIKDNEYVNKLNSLGDCLDDAIMFMWRA